MIGLSLDDLHYSRNNIVWIDNSPGLALVPGLDKFSWNIFIGRAAHLHQTRGTIPSLMRWSGMNQITTELREAAASARAFADNIGSAELKRSFREMARRWEAEADECETQELHRGRRRRPREAGRKAPTSKH